MAMLNCYYAIIKQSEEIYRYIMILSFIFIMLLVFFSNLFVSCQEKDLDIFNQLKSSMAQFSEMILHVIIKYFTNHTSKSVTLFYKHI